jgi:hypothetical protein
LLNKHCFVSEHFESKVSMGVRETGCIDGKGYQNTLETGKKDLENYEEYSPLLVCGVPFYSLPKNVWQ